MRKFKLLGRDIVIGKDITGYAGRTDDLFGIYANKFGFDFRTRNKLDAYKNIVYSCVSLLGEQYGKYEPQVQRKNGDQWETVDHELIDLINNPGGKDADHPFSAFELWEATGSYQELQGDCFWYLALGKTTGRPREIVILRPDRVGTDIDPDTGKVSGYFIRQASGTPLPLELNEVLRFPKFNPKDPYKGLSAVEAGSDYITADEGTAEFTKNFFQNGAGLSGVLNIKGEVTKGAFRKFVRAWRDKHEGVNNAGKVAILRDSDASFESVGLGLNDLDMSGLRKMSLDDVAMLFRVPLPLLGRLTEGTGLGRGNIETLEYIFAKYKVDPMLERYDNILQFALNRYYPDTVNGYRVVHKSIIPEDKEYKLNLLDKMVDRTIKRNEARDEEGLDSVDGGDELFTTIQQVPLGESASRPAAGSGSGKELTVKIVRKITKAPEDLPSQTQARERFHLSLMRNQSKYERAYRRKLDPLFAKQKKEALNNLEAHAQSLKSLKKNYQPFDPAQANKDMVDDLTPLLTDLTSTQGALALIFAGDTDSEFFMNATILTFLNNNTKKMAANFNQQTIDQLNATLAEGIQAGEGIGDLRSRVSDVFDGIDSYRAERLARTETLKASNNATLWAYKQTGYVTAKAWAVNPDACPECEEFDGKTVPLDDAFLNVGESYTYTDQNGDQQEQTNDYDTVETPPLHPNCRCTIIPVRE